jgi:hypothetical protein
MKAFGISGFWALNVITYKFDKIKEGIYFFLLKKKVISMNLRVFERTSKLL